MEFDALDFLQSLFDECPASSPPAALIVTDDHAVLAMPDAAVHPIELGELVEAVELVDAPPCDRCGSYEVWQTLAGSWRCQHCDAAALARSRAWLETASRLREQFAGLH